MALTFKQKIILATAMAGLIPLLVIGGASLYLQRHNIIDSVNESLAHAHQLTNARIEDYFATTEHHLLTVAHDPAVHTALKDFSAAVAELDTSSVNVDSASLRERYVVQQSKTKGTTSGDVEGWVPQDAKTRALQYLYITQNSNPLGEKQKLDAAPDGSTYSTVHAKYHPRFREIVSAFGYYDFFLIDAQSGLVVYTNFKEIDFMTSVKTGPLASSGFSTVVKQALASSDPDKYFISNFAPYMPSYNDPASFVAIPIVEDGKTIGALAFQLPLDKLNAIFKPITQMGETADGYLVSPEMTFVTPPLTEDFKSGDAVSEQLKEPLKKVFADNYDGPIEFAGPDGKPMLGAAKKVAVNGLNVAIVIGIDAAEVEGAFFELAYIIIGIIIATAVLSTAAGWGVGAVLVKPIVRLAQSFHVSAEKVARATGQVGEAVSSMIAASEETSAQSTVVRKNSSEASGYVGTVSTAVDELNISINDISQSIGETNVLIDDAVGKAKKTDEVVRSLGEASKKITEVVSLINDLAEQTNLLALNAAIEAARAGDAGRGFAVVADEVKKLASHTSQATVDIREQVREIQEVSEQSVVALQAVVEAIHRIRDNATTVSAAVEEQSGVAKQIAGSVKDAANRVQQVDENMNGIEQAANDTGVAADQVNGSSTEVQGAFNEMKSQVQSVLDEMGIKG